MAALTWMRDLLRPGGVLAIAGLARSRCPADLARDIAARPVDLLLKARRRHWWQVRVRYRRHLLYRYSLSG